MVIATPIARDFGTGYGSPPDPDSESIPRRALDAEIAAERPVESLLVLG